MASQAVSASEITPQLSNTTIGSGEPTAGSSSAPVSTRDTPSTHVVSAENGETGGVEGSIGGDAPVEKKRVKLEDFTKCSESLLWKLMMSFYDRKGVDSWSQGIVPHFITCNAFIGKVYARVLKGWLEDVQSSSNSGLHNTMKLDPTKPLYIIELGTGAGKFSFFMLKALWEMADVLPFPVEKIVYVMTDFTESNFNFWKTHPVLHEWVEKGALEFAIFDAVNDDSIKLHNSGKVLGGDNPTDNPICVVANYLFDTLCHDIFQVEKGVLKEGLISVGSSREKEDDILDPDIIKNFSNLYQYNEIDRGYYAEGKDAVDAEHLGRILEWYRDFFDKNDPDDTGASILFPIGAMRALRRLSNMGGGRMVVISGDKGNNNVQQFRGLLDPHIAVHGSFSLMVNYHAIGAYFTSRGGFALHNPQEEASLKVSCFVLPGEKQKDDKGIEVKEGDLMGEGMERIDRERERDFPNLKHAFKDWAENFGPNDFFIMQKSMKEDAVNPSLKSVVALLKLCDWDPDVFYKFRDVILNQVCQANAKLRNDLCRGIPRVWDNYYQLDKEKDVSFEIGRFFYGIRDFGKALRYYTISSETIGEHHVTFHNMGLCFYSLNMTSDAVEHFQKSIKMNAKYVKAQNWLEKVQKEIEAKNAMTMEMAEGATAPVVA
ncbi:hypothetical protein TrRE_jg1017, partial [Triparma retinervis]